MCSWDVVGLNVPEWLVFLTIIHLCRAESARISLPKVNVEKARSLKFGRSDREGGWIARY